MPFKSESQRKKCWADYDRDLKAGRTPKWDCHEWANKSRKSSSVKRRGLIAERRTSRQGSRGSRRKQQGGVNSDYYRRSQGSRNMRRYGNELNEDRHRRSNSGRIA